MIDVRSVSMSSSNAGFPQILSGRNVEIGPGVHLDETVRIHGSVRGTRILISLPKETSMPGHML